MRPVCCCRTPSYSSFSRSTRRIRLYSRHPLVRAKDLKEVLRDGGFEPDPEYVEGGDFLRTIGMTNQAEISRVLDIAMNPNSLFLSPRERKLSTAAARRLSVEDDMKPVISYLREIGIEDKQIVQMISKMPCLLAYSLDGRIRPVLEYLSAVGIQHPEQVIARRPSLLGLDVDQNLKKIVGYLKANDYTMDQIVEWLETSI